jgi:hypothetical protein
MGAGQPGPALRWDLFPNPSPRGRTLIQRFVIEDLECIERGDEGMPGTGQGNRAKEIRAENRMAALNAVIEMLLPEGTRLSVEAISEKLCSQLKLNSNAKPRNARKAMERIITWVRNNLDHEKEKVGRFVYLRLSPRLRRKILAERERATTNGYHLECHGPLKVNAHSTVALYSNRLEISEGRQEAQLPAATSVNGEAGPTADPSRTPATETGRAFVPTAFQLRILQALERKNLTADELEGKVDSDRKRLFRDGLNPLKKAGKIANRRSIGYFRPDSPPPLLAAFLEENAKFETVAPLQ